MSALDQAISTAWRDAASDLQIRVFAPHRVELQSRPLDVELFLPDFGSRTGAIAVSEGNRASEAALRQHHWCSVLGERYRIYERALFVDTLNDWGWCGVPDAAPHWYTGKHWS